MDKKQWVLAIVLGCSLGGGYVLFELYHGPGVLEAASRPSDVSLAKPTPAPAIVPIETPTPEPEPLPTPSPSDSVAPSPTPNPTPFITSAEPPEPCKVSMGKDNNSLTVITKDGDFDPEHNPQNGAVFTEGIRVTKISPHMHELQIFAAIYTTDDQPGLSSRPNILRYDVFRNICLPWFAAHHTLSESQIALFGGYYGIGDPNQAAILAAQKSKKVLPAPTGKKVLLAKKTPSK